MVTKLIFRVCLDRTYFAENWKNCSKIIFKCVNSAVRHIFNEKVDEKWSLWVPWIVHGTHWCGWKWVKKSNSAATVHEQCMNSSRTFSFAELNACPKKKKKERVKRTFAQNVKRRLVSKSHLRIEIVFLRHNF